MRRTLLLPVVPLVQMQKMGSLYPAYFSVSGVGDCEAMAGGRVVTSGSLRSELSTQNIRTDRSALSSSTAGIEGVRNWTVGVLFQQTFSQFSRKYNSFTFCYDQSMKQRLLSGNKCQSIFLAIIMICSIQFYVYYTVNMLFIFFINMNECPCYLPEIIIN